ncbi:MAG: formylglycine-generating enzyme family protein [Chromatiaceae bacterium]|nr:formylglycine-generating enzyme family protein [Chromatiaceae bacterium]MCP5436145.1 formylglycine-generating enzyme family protein [Chromatiaceae bacterium]HOP17321.1 formylglycine-generating enzyme family protein [Gammaproteobacteria bacterium]HPQ23749.1 formylglycine-generating enzyme family protein [Gammaproteobacteria bacterium]
MISHACNAVGVFLLSASLCAAPPVVGNSIGMRFSELPAATFQMGTADIDEARFEHPDADKADIGDETPAHRVTLGRPTLMAQTETTQGQWFTVMQNRPGPAEFWQRDDWEQLPVVGVDWFMAQRFTEELGVLDPRFTYRLPTEAEWEYAARAGQSGLRPVALADLEDHAWYIHNSDDLPHPVATRKANAFGLYDMLGNAWEWVADGYARDTYARRAAASSPSVDPSGAQSSELRVRRGGSYHCPQHLVRPGYRTADNPEKRYSVLGFRVVALPRDPSTPR